MKKEQGQKGVFKGELPPWLSLPTDDYDAELVAAQDAVSRMSAQEKTEAMNQITEVFKKRRIKY